MGSRSTQLLKLVLETMHATRAHRLVQPWTRGVGAIFMLHQVCPPSGEAFEPSRILQVTPEFLDQAIRMVRAEGFDIVSLDAVHERLRTPRTGAPFACFTLDDGYMDNLTHAMPVFDAHDVPFAVYLPDTFADGKGDLWWLVLEAALRKADRVEINVAGAPRCFDTSTLDGKEAAHAEIYWWLRSIDEDDARNVVDTLAQSHEVDRHELMRDLLMTWDDVRLMHANPRATIAAHTSGHYAMARLSQERMQTEVETNLRRLEQELGARPQHFSYPYGCPQSAGAREFDWLKTLDMKTAVTTRKGMVFEEHAHHLTALPRFSLNGDFQNVRQLNVLLSGAPFALLNKGRKLNVS